MITATIRPRIDDLGPAGHIHNTVLPAWFQEARYEILEACSPPMTPDLLPLMIKEYTVTFHRELVLSPEVVIEIHVERIGNSSFVLQETAWQRNHKAATSRVVYVYVGADSQPSPIPDQLRIYLAQHCVQGSVERLTGSDGQ